jgi:hypothetical protein
VRAAGRAPLHTGNHSVNLSRLNNCSNRFARPNRRNAGCAGWEPRSILHRHNSAWAPIPCQRASPTLLSTRMARDRSSLWQSRPFRLRSCAKPPIFAVQRRTKERIEAICLPDRCRNVPRLSTAYAHTIEVLPRTAV